MNRTELYMNICTLCKEHPDFQAVNKTQTKSNENVDFKRTIPGPQKASQTQGKDPTHWFNYPWVSVSTGFRNGPPPPCGYWGSTVYSKLLVLDWKGELHTWDLFAHTVVMVAGVMNVEVLLHIHTFAERCLRMNNYGSDTQDTQSRDCFLQSLEMEGFLDSQEPVCTVVTVSDKAWFQIPLSHLANCAALKQSLSHNPSYFTGLLWE